MVKQTQELLLCLILSSNAETALNRYRTKAFTGFGLLPTLPPVIPLFFMTELPSFEMSRRVASLPWKPDQTNFELSIVAGSGTQDVVIAVDPAAWKAFCTDARFVLGPLARSDVEPSSLAVIGPWIVLGQTVTLRAAEARFDSFGAVPVISLRKVSLAVFRISREHNDEIQSMCWELMGSWRVPVR